MDYMNYKTIQVMKKSERVEVLFTAVEEMEQPVVIKKLTEANPKIYREVEKLQSKHLPKIYHVEELDKLLVVAEEYIAGRTLSAYLAEEMLTDVQKLELMLQLCEALEALHQCEPPVIHRDIKPSNLLINQEGILKVIDFDAARYYKAEKNTSDTRLLGTIEYAAPEQFGYSQTDLRSDIYSVGVVFSEIEIDKESPYAKAWKKIVDKCTSFDPENRYKNVSDLKNDLKKCISKAEERGQSLCFLVVSVLILVFLLIGSLLLVEKNKEDKISTSASAVADKRVVGGRTETAGYLISAMDYKESRHSAYHVNDSGSLSVRFEKIYGSVIFELPDIIDMNYCVDVMTKIKTRVGDVAFILYDENCMPVETFYIEKTEEAGEFFFSPKYKGTVAYVGFMANDGELEDYSEFAATVYYVDFMVINPDTPKISYTIAELTEENYYFLDRTYNDDGSVTMDFERLYGQLFLRLPKEVDLRDCVGIGVVMESEVGDLTVCFYDKEFNNVESFFDYTTDGVDEKLCNPLSGAMVGGIGLMIDDQELEDYSDCAATVYAVNFYMRDDYRK